MGPSARLLVAAFARFPQPSTDFAERFQAIQVGLKKSPVCYERF
jgi:hypothetical protein